MSLLLSYKKKILQKALETFFENGNYDFNPVFLHTRQFEAATDDGSILPSAEMKRLDVQSRRQICLN